MKVSELCAKYGIKPSKKLGQHFLIDRNVIRREVEEAEIKENETVLEIGPGLGFLTKELVKKARKVVAIEKDKKLIEILKNELKDAKNVEIMQGDALRVKWPSFDKCVANIPYQISSGVIENLGKKQKFSILILQKEFAERLIAEAGKENYSRLTILARYFFTPVIVLDVPRNAFCPQPEVDSAMVKLYPKKSKPNVKDEKFFFLLTRALFNHPNQNVAKAFIHSRHEFRLSKEKAQEIARSLPLREKKVYHLSLDEIAQISNHLANLSF